MKEFIKEFKAFIARGNVIDMAVGVVIGAAFWAIVTSLVDNIIMPLIGILIGGINFESLSITVGGAEVKYGMFIQSIVNFLIIAFVIFLVIKQIGKLTSKMKKEEPKVEKEKSCPYCFTQIPIEAIRCPHCTSKLSKW